MAAGDYLMGLDGKFLYGTAGSQASTEADNVDGVNLSLSAEVAEAKRRGKTWVANKVTYLSGEVTWNMYDIEADAFLTAVKNAYMGQSKIALYPTDKASGEGLDADFYITGFNRTEDNDGYIMYAVTAKPTDEQRNPTWT
jgi:hypothetical protein